MEFHRRGRFSGVNAIETPYGNMENNVDDNRITSDNKSSPYGTMETNVDDNHITSDNKSSECRERSMFQFDFGKNQPPNKRARNLNPPLPNLMASKEEEQVGSMRQHNEDRMSEAICLLPGFGNKMISNGSNFKTRLCNKWELTRWCPFGDKCHFAHGSAELRGYDGQLLKTEAGNSSARDVKQTTLPYRAAGIPLRNGMQEETPTRRWKGPNKISKIYGDWIDDL